mmetsp:Transcript_10136/g.9085  ORF Transcript_10136/g.9085 Transcript_10136/m.9085 type:complete len:133 (+) Transcript_10136:30-428(+)
MTSLILTDNDNQNNPGNSIIRLTYRDKVPISLMKEIMSSVISNKLYNFNQYDAEKANESVKSISEQIKQKLKSLGYDRYKYVVQVIIGERREQGVRTGTRCFWDSGTDNQATETFTNDYIFCVAIVYAVYLY